MRIFTRSNFMKHLYKAVIEYSHYCFDKICTVEFELVGKQVLLKQFWTAPTPVTFLANSTTLVIIIIE